MHLDFIVHVSALAWEGGGVGCFGLFDYLVSGRSGNDDPVAVLRGGVTAWGS